VVAESGLSASTLLHPLVMATPAMLRPPPSSPYGVDPVKRWPGYDHDSSGLEPTAADPASSPPSIATSAGGREVQ